MKELERLGYFLGVSPDERLKDQILDMYSFEKMKAEKIEAVMKASKNPSMSVPIKKGFQVFRKGILLHKDIRILYVC